MCQAILLAFSSKKGVTFAVLGYDFININFFLNFHLDKVKAQICVKTHELAYTPN